MAKLERRNSTNAHDTLSSTPSELGVSGDKQDVSKIYSALHSCISRISKELLRRVIHISVCGQMHGVVYWKQEEGWTRNSKDQVEVGSGVSSLYTWQDGRCTPDYLSTLPKPNSHLTLNSGYGCATTFWFLHNRTEYIKQFDRFGTIMDFIVAMILGLEFPVMADQNAASFGYFDSINMNWNKDLLQEAGFSTNLLPQVVRAGISAGNLVKDWFDVPAGTPVSAAMGDLQCSVKSTLETPETDAVVNVSTSAQMAFVQPEGFQPKLISNENLHKPVEYFPYFEDRYIAVAASMTGGNALAAFIKMIQQWVIQLGVNVTQSKIWETALAAGFEEKNEPSIDILPTIFGERHSPEQKGSAVNINQGNLGLGEVTRSVCRGIIANLAAMMPPEMLKQRGITRIVGSGACLIRNQVLQREIQEQYRLPVIFEDEGNACIGAALAVSDKFYPTVIKKK
ncbi:sedoheptulokinase isoform X2 [Eurytemora carolleeae]|uniref:sedoheptulokinase isoform X2 n=1 Tax=Eurytemora carolleeae TaxID=1294199 RepID=UPI000C773EFF|nr:sedoheptulokinase isoform X2 [Eurytemora carolleeae]|eukprot:XP_023322512.1 sedoheptulokinase-like isoform X2 [Eurytemora affinis]